MPLQQPTPPTCFPPVNPAALALPIATRTAPHAPAPPPPKLQNAPGDDDDEEGEGAGAGAAEAGGAIGKYSGVKVGRAKQGAFGTGFRGPEWLFACAPPPTRAAPLPRRSHSLNPAPPPPRPRPGPAPPQVRVAFARGAETTSLRSLSGGQKTLVALALIFAIQRCDPVGGLRAGSLRPKSGQASDQERVHMAGPREL
jgi:hypothetical protein